MNEKTESFLSQMLEGYESNLGPVKAAIDQMEQQLAQMCEQRDGMEKGIGELKELLGLEEEETEAPKLQLVSDEEE
jgi:hypothetical protein